VKSSMFSVNHFSALRKNLLPVLIAALTFISFNPPGVVESRQNKKAPQEQKDAQKDPQKDEQDEPLRLSSDLVVLSVTVTNETGKYAHGLKLKDFTLNEDGVAQSINSFAADEEPFAAAILVDMSGSMSYKFGLVRAAAASFIEQIRDNDQVAVYGFNDKVKRFQDFSNARDITDYIWDAEAKETTKLYDCLNEALEALAARAEKRRAILLISDGCDTSSQKVSFDAVMKKALAAGVNIYAVDLIDNTDMAGSSSSAMLMLQRGRGEMKEFANQTGAQYIHSPKGDNLQEALNNVIDELRNQYTLTYYTSNAKRDGRYRKINVTLGNPKLSARTRRGYYAPKK
jgi:Ca-activated chloride channel family protein